MKKKGLLTFDFTIITLVVLIIIGLLIFYALDMVFTDNALDKGCEAIGMKEYVYVNGFMCCLDYENNVYFIISECRGFFHRRYCDVEIINIGEFRIK